LLLTLEQAGERVDSPDGARHTLAVDGSPPLLTSSPLKRSYGVVTRLGRPPEYQDKVKLALYVERAAVPAYKQAAARAGLSLSDWARGLLDAATGQVSAGRKDRRNRRRAQGAGPASSRIRKE
jgi:hypothetical protein